MTTRKKILKQLESEGWQRPNCSNCSSHGIANSLGREGEPRRGDRVACFKGHRKPITGVCNPREYSPQTGYRVIGYTEREKIA